MSPQNRPLAFEKMNAGKVYGTILIVIVAMRFFTSQRCAVKQQGKMVVIGGGEGGSAAVGSPFEANSGRKTLSVSLAQHGMFSVATVGVVHLGEALEVDSMINLKREMSEANNLFSCASSYGWRSDGSLWYRLI